MRITFIVAIVAVGFFTMSGAGCATESQTIGGREVDPLTGRPMRELPGSDELGPISNESYDGLPPIIEVEERDGEYVGHVMFEVPTGGWNLRIAGGRLDGKHVRVFVELEAPSPDDLTTKTPQVAMTTWRSKKQFERVTLLIKRTVRMEPKDGVPFRSAGSFVFES